MNLHVHKLLEIFYVAGWLTDWLLASKGLGSMELISSLVAQNGIY
jgi:hypothetical protein